MLHPDHLLFPGRKKKKTLKIKTPSFALNKSLSKIPDPPNVFLNIHQHKYEVLFTADSGDTDELYSRERGCLTSVALHLRMLMSVGTECGADSPRQSYYCSHSACYPADLLANFHLPP